MKLLIVIVVILVVAWMINNLRKALKAEKAKNAPQPRTDPFKTETFVGGDPRQIEIGDAVEILGITYTVRGAADFVEGPYRWTGHYFDDGSGRRRWLTVEEDPDLKLVLWEELTDSGLASSGKIVAYGGRQYAREEIGSAIYTSRGTTGLAPSGTVDYIDYKSGDRWLSFESYDGARQEVSAGEEVHLSSVTIYPVGRNTAS